jgi:hypothetical protein
MCSEDMDSDHLFASRWERLAFAGAALVVSSASRSAAVADQPAAGWGGRWQLVRLGALFRL